jgi:hypothetical protein
MIARTIAESIMDAAELRMRGAGFNGFSSREIADDVGIQSSSVHYISRRKRSSPQRSCTGMPTVSASASSGGPP